MAIIGTVAAIGFVFFRPPVVFYPFAFGFFPFWPFFAFFWIFAIFFVLRWVFFPWRWGYSRRYWGGWGYGDRAYYVLRERYARGEITKDQYEQMMRDLQTHTQPQ